MLQLHIVYQNAPFSAPQKNDTNVLKLKWKKEILRTVCDIGLLGCDANYWRKR